MYILDTFKKDLMYLKPFQINYLLPFQIKAKERYTLHALWIICFYIILFIICNKEAIKKYLLRKCGASKFKYYITILIKY